MLNLIDENKLSLDDPLTNFFTGLPDEKQNITIKDLVFHSSGLGPQIIKSDSFLNGQDLSAIILNQPLEYLPGSKAIYSELNLILLQKIIVKVAGLDIKGLIHKNITSPMQMVDTKYIDNKDFNGDDDNIKFYNRIKSGNDSLKNLLPEISGFGGLNTTALDLSKIAQLFTQDGYYDRFQIVNYQTFNDWLNEIKNISYGEFQVSILKDNSGKILTVSFIDTKGNSLWIDKLHNSFLIVLTTSQFQNQPNQKFADFISGLNSKVFDELNSTNKK
jgi:CubicO group peptidase (beta-lactamase class C family)